MASASNKCKLICDTFKANLFHILAGFMLETLKLSKTLKPSRDDFNI